jgi:integrase
MVRPRGNKFQVDFRHGNERIRRSFDTEVEALKWEAWAKERLAKGLSLEEAVVKDGLTMASLAEMVRAKYWAGRPNEVNAVRNADEMVELLGPDRHPKEITESDIDAAVAQLKAKGNSAATINRKIAALTKMFTHAVTRGMIDRKPHIEKMREREGRLRWYTLDEERAILDKINQFRIDGFADLVVFLLDTGCRLGEALALEARYTSDTHVVFERTKNGRRRSVPLTARSREIIEPSPGSGPDRPHLLRVGQEPGSPGLGSCTPGRGARQGPRGRAACLPAYVRLQARPGRRPHSGRPAVARPPDPDHDPEVRPPRAGEPASGGSGPGQDCDHAHG